ncbi:MAG: phosphoribosylamine--glycine ligase, partial [Faecalibacterium sp.]
FTDGKVVKPMVSSMDHKRANDHDTGLNTGGMGTVAPNPYYTPEVADRCMREIFLPTIAAMNAEGCPFKGCLYFGLMITPDGPKVIEYNCRFGDPETQVVLPLLQSDLLQIMTACTEGTLADTEVRFSEGAAACVILASGGYPVSYEKGKPISGLTDGQLPDEPNVTVYHSGTAFQDGQLVTAGGRVLGVSATADDLPEALARAYKAADRITFEKLHRRSDIGLRALKALAEG